MKNRNDACQPRQSLLRRHRDDCFLAGKEHAGEVEIYGTAPQRFRSLRRRHALDHVTGIVDEDPQAPETFQMAPEDHGDTLSLAQIGLHGERGTPGRLDARNLALSGDSIGVVGEGHGGAGCGQCFGDGATDATAAASHQRRLSPQIRARSSESLGHGLAKIMACREVRV